MSTREEEVKLTPITTVQDHINHYITVIYRQEDGRYFVIRSNVLTQVPETYVVRTYKKARQIADGHH